MWALTSDVVKLNAHVGHEVTVTGHAPETKRQENAGSKDGQLEQAASREDYGDLRVANIKMVSDTCSK